MPENPTSEKEREFKKKFNSKSDAMSYEYKLKKDRIFRKKIIEKFDK